MIPGVVRNARRAGNTIVVIVKINAQSGGAREVVFACDGSQLSVHLVGIFLVGSFRFNVDHVPLGREASIDLDSNGVRVRRTAYDPAVHTRSRRKEEA